MFSFKRIVGWLDGHRELRKKKKGSLKEEVIIMILLMVLRKPLLLEMLPSMSLLLTFSTLKKDLDSTFVQLKQL